MFCCGTHSDIVIISEMWKDRRTGYENALVGAGALLVIGFVGAGTHLSID